MKYIIIYIILGILISSCNQESKKANSVNRKTVDRNVFLGVWKSVERPYPYAGYLFIKSDSTFTYEFGACIMSGFSFGKWIIKDDILVLKSSDTDLCFYTNPFDSDCTLIEEIIIVIDSMTNTIPLERSKTNDCEPETIEEFIIFANEEFYFDNDTLKHISRIIKNCPDVSRNFTR